MFKSRKVQNGNFYKQAVSIICFRFSLSSDTRSVKCLEGAVRFIASFCAC